MDGLDIYIDDYSKPDPIDPDVVRQMVQGRYIFDPPQTRVNAQGFVEDVPPEESVPPLAEPRLRPFRPTAPSDADAVASTPAGQREPVPSGVRRTERSGRRSRASPPSIPVVGAMSAAGPSQGANSSLSEGRREAPRVHQ